MSTWRREPVPGRGTGAWRGGPGSLPISPRRAVGRLEVAAALAGLSARDPLAAAVVHAARPRGSFWRLRLDPPLPPGQSLTLKASRALEPAGISRRPFWQVPLPLVLGATRSEG